MKLLPIVLIHGFSAESEEKKPDEDEARVISRIQKIYGRLPHELANLQTGTEVVDVNISRYVSLDDRVDLDDLTLALDRVLKTEFARLLDSGFNAIVHSTGALVMRNWVRRCTTPRTAQGVPAKCAVKRIIHLAGANWGSGWAHVGESQIAKWLRGAIGEQRGLAVLDGLELGSSWTIDLHYHFLRPGQDMLEDYDVMEFNIIGSQVEVGIGVIAPVRYGKEDGSDGVIRVSACNLNHNYLRIGPAQDPQDVNWTKVEQFTRETTPAGGPANDDADDADNFRYAVAKFAEDEVFAGGYYKVTEDLRPHGRPDEPLVAQGEATRLRERVPFSIPYQCAHSGKNLGIVSGEQTREQVLNQLLVPALSCEREQYKDMTMRFRQVMLDTYDRVRDTGHKKSFLERLGERFGQAVVDDWKHPEAQYDKHSQVIVRVRDQNNKPIRDCSIHFNSLGGADKPEELINHLVEDQHENNTTPGIHTFYLRGVRWNESKRDWDDLIPKLSGIDFEVDVVDVTTKRILFVPLRMRISPEDLQQFIHPHRTTIIDVQLLRLPSEDTFRIYRQEAVRAES